MNIQQGIQSAVDGVDLSQSEAADVMAQIMGGEATEAQFGSFVTALRMKGETPEEIAGMASVMRDVSLHVNSGSRDSRHLRDRRRCQRMVQHIHRRRFCRRGRRRARRQTRQPGNVRIYG